MARGVAAAAWFVLTAVAGVLACDRGASGGSNDGGALAVVLDTTAGAGNATIVVHGLSSDELRSLQSGMKDESDWHRFLRITVAGNDVLPVKGEYRVAPRTVEFRPLYPLDRGLAYTIRLDAAPTLPARDTAQLRIDVALPEPVYGERTQVLRVLPSTDTVPENLLRLYIEFSAPMSRQGGTDHVKLLDSLGREVVDPFLPLEADFWNAGRTRYTLFMDPGRVKQGILPNEQMGRAILAGGRYRVVVDSTWRDAEGRDLYSSYSREFRVKAPDTSVIDMSAWRVIAPDVGTRAPLVVRLDKPLDHGLLQRAIGVERSGRGVAGRLDVAAGEREIMFVPDSEWRAGEYELIVLEILEDPSGNRVDRPFEVDMFQRADSNSAPSRYSVSFRIGS